MNNANSYFHTTASAIMMSKKDDSGSSKESEKNSNIVNTNITTSTTNDIPTTNDISKFKSLPTNSIQIPLTFNHGHFRLYLFDRYEVILHYWQPIEALYHNLLSEILPNIKKDNNNIINVKLIYKFRMYNQEDLNSDYDSDIEESSNNVGSSSSDSKTATRQHQYRLSSSMPFGYLFVALNPARIQLLGFVKSDKKQDKDSTTILFQFKLDKDTLKRVIEWSNQNSGATVSSGTSVMTSSGRTSEQSSFARQELMVLIQIKCLIIFYNFNIYLFIYSFWNKKKIYFILSLIHCKFSSIILLHVPNLKLIEDSNLVASFCCLLNLVLLVV